MIVGVLSQKGGVGKTTIAINLAATLSVAKNRLLLVDADPQGSALAWSSARDKDPLFPVVGMAKPTLHRDLPEIAKDYDVVVIDGAAPPFLPARPCADPRPAVALRRMGCRDCAADPRSPAVQARHQGRICD